MVLGKICKDAIMMAIISRVIIGASLLISTFFGLFRVVVAAHQNRVQAITLYNLTGSEVELTVTPEGKTVNWDSEANASNHDDREKHNDCQIAKKISQSNQDNTGDFMGPTLKKTLKISSTNIEKTFSTRTPKHGEKNKFTIELKINNNDDKKWTVECTPTGSYQKPLNCRTISNNQIKCGSIDKEFKIINANSVELKRKYFKCLSDKNKNFNIYSPVLVVYDLSSVNNSSAFSSSLTASPSPSAPPPYSSRASKAS